MAVVGDRIVAVGADADVRPLGSADTRWIDLRGRRLIPGLMDNHTHYLLAGLDAPEVGAKVNLARAQSIAEILREIRRKVDVTPAGEWVASSASTVAHWPRAASRTATTSTRWLPITRCTSSSRART